MDFAPAPSATVLLLHGLCGNPLELAPLARRLREAGHRVEAPDLPGYGVPVETAGRAPAPVPPFEQWLEQARAHYDALAGERPTAPPIVGGLGSGALLALGLGLQRRPGALLLLSTCLHSDGWAVPAWQRLLPLGAVPAALRQRLAWRERAPFGLKNEQLRAWVAQALRATTVSPAGAARTPLAALHERARLQRYLRPHLRDVEAPALILHARADELAGPRSVIELRRALPNSRTQWFDRSYSLLSLDQERGAVADAALGFLDELRPQRLAA
ncbi:alpha/beta hydrolase [Roseateles violae]|uniref:Alpha/beta hydrolase n=1 Tax=Roseateles violae TaxID=3058042 RepID=A0ABT8DX60_9BURK|nr:alpha/beta hydrolase [Pelomonas sp. PFR6]MDN3921242.1 alpha/beta hydrolase [Pelomonas sp. PFR6]